MKIQNPILKGFNPDPSIVRAGDDYYIATSTFEWFPGVQIHHSKGPSPGHHRIPGHEGQSQFRRHLGARPFLR